MSNLSKRDREERKFRSIFGVSVSESHDPQIFSQRVRGLLRSQMARICALEDEAGAASRSNLSAMGAEEDLQAHCFSAGEIEKWYRLFHEALGAAEAVGFDVSEDVLMSTDIEPPKTGLRIVN